MLKRIKVMLAKEFRQLFRDPRMRMVIFMAPIVQLVVFAFAITTDVNNISAGIVDFDNSSESRGLVSAFTSSGYFKVKQAFVTVDSATDALDKGEIQCFIVTNAGFASDIAAGETAPLEVVIDGTDSTTAATILGYAAHIAAQYSADVLLDALSRSGETFGQPLDVRSRAWFNARLESRIFYIPGLLATVLTLITLMLTGLAIVREKKMITIDQIMVTPIKPHEFILGKTLPYAASGIFVITLMLLVARIVFPLPIRGNIALFYLGALLYLLSTLSGGLLISATSATQQQAMLSTFLYMMPLILLSGFMFPIANMPEPVQAVTLFNPMRYFVVILRGVLLKGVGFDVLWTQFAALAAIGIATLALAANRFTKTMG